MACQRFRLRNIVRALRRGRNYSSGRSWGAPFRLAGYSRGDYGDRFRHWADADSIRSGNARANAAKLARRWIGFRADASIPAASVQKLSHLGFPMQVFDL